MPSNELKATIPASLNECNVCPITTSYLFDPVSLKHNDESEICMENNMFERSVIERHMENKSTCPMCRKEIIEIVPLDSNYVDELEKIYDKENAWDQVYFDFKGFIECAQKGNLNNELGKKYLKILLASPEEITRKQDIVEDFETPLAVIAQFGDLSTFKEFFNKSQAKIDYNFINELQNFVKPEISNFLFEVIKDIASIEEILGVDSVSINREFHNH